ncbi:glyceraldehyde-3-phosphate dehydrogenase/erythrose-4-phosphate dehydrogenase [Candidatus Scalindua japonica]|uniref:Glyceraldehyde-3-phosphate dehydrogenase/erythrose-4-phosphate dehydrogenase n=1 Tax=Candidatus Scalindua japonica TaxID=1284222 RepID=A0A286U335_9BACT|nr:hypothetical protein [Candidatus Scalindua japonica]GAX62481.1 glyceraldehyde-3-phosphate dehydrogenase/erythrose-4-phosphate dehydrogenase [Candidatus Scalindua japonica]
MVNIDKYLNLVEHNSNLLRLITEKPSGSYKDVDFSDWQVTIIFYISCIYLKSVCSIFGLDVQNHFTIRKTMNERDELRPIFNDYRKIEEASRDARYEGKKFEERIIKKRILPRFNTVRDCVVEIIKNNGISKVPVVNLDFL